jgi:hypothetical protein|tara:strand:+ start:462 stop:644 length:183 start_codon:yes stop_codon:yes gene_type:complete
MDTDVAKQILQGDDTHPDILQALGLEILDEYNYLLAEVKRLKRANDDAWGMLEEAGEYND